MKVNRKKVYLGIAPKNDNDYANIAPAERVSLIWEITAELWSLRNAAYVKRRLQRNITNLIKK